LTAIGIPVGLVAGIGTARRFSSNYENLGCGWELRLPASGDVPLESLHLQRGH
jgi:hypothetical protein